MGLAKGSQEVKGLADWVGRAINEKLKKLYGGEGCTPMTRPVSVTREPVNQAPTVRSGLNFYRSTLVPLSTPLIPSSLQFRIRNTDAGLASDLRRPGLESVIAGDENFPSVLL